MNRPILCWLNKLPDGYRERAVANHSTTEASRRLCSFGYNEAGCMTDAVDKMARWFNTREGDRFWDAVYEHYKHRQNPEGHPYKPLPELPTT